MRKLLPSSLTGRLVVTVVALVAVASLLVAGAVTLVMSHYLTDRLDEKLTESMGRAQHAPTAAAQPTATSDDQPPNPGRGQDVGLITVIPGYGRGSIVTESGDAPADLDRRA